MARDDSFYAVAHGRQQGIYRTWAEAKAQVDGFSNAIYMKFATEREARDYLAGIPSDHEGNDDSTSELEDKFGSLAVESAQREVPLHPDPGFVVFCSGSALDNGSDDGHAAFACVFPNQQSWDIVDSLDGASKSNRAVYCAALEAIRRVNEQDKDKGCALTICSNSELLIKSMTEWISTWLENNDWRTSKNKPVKNQDVLKAILREQGRRKVQWVYTKAHAAPQTWDAMWINHAFRTAQAHAKAARNA